MERKSPYPDWLVGLFCGVLFVAAILAITASGWFLLHSDLKFTAPLTATEQCEADCDRDYGGYADASGDNRSIYSDCLADCRFEKYHEETAKETSKLVCQDKCLGKSGKYLSAEYADDYTPYSQCLDDCK